MTTETETVADVLAEMRNLGHETPWNFATRIAAAHAREVELLKQANIAYSSENANLRGRAMTAEAKIDALMLEYCPDEMTPEQVETWGKSQRVAKLRKDVLCVRCNKPTMHIGSVCYGCLHTPMW